MKSAAKNIARSASSAIAARVDAVDWVHIGAELDAQGSAVIDNLLTLQECATLAALYPDDTHFRSRIVMGRHGFGRGEYKYFSYPLPDIIAQLRPALYQPLQALPTAGTRRWASICAIRTRTKPS